MNKDFRINVGFFTHPKTIKLQRRLGADGVLAFLRILAYTATNRPTGVLDGVDLETLGIAADYDDIKALVDALVDIGFLDRRGKRICVHDWAKHNGYAAHAEARSERARTAANARWERENGQCGEHATSMQQAQSSNAPSPVPDPFNQMPDPKPKPDPSQPLATEGKELQPPPSCPHEKIIDLYNQVLSDQFGKVMDLTPQRIERLEQAWKKNTEWQDLNWWHGFFGYVRDDCKFLCGKEFVDFDWIIDPEHFVKTAEGKYEIKWGQNKHHTPYYENQRGAA